MKRNKRIQLTNYPIKCFNLTSYFKSKKNRSQLVYKLSYLQLKYCKMYYLDYIYILQRLLALGVGMIAFNIYYHTSSFKYYSVLSNLYSLLFHSTQPLHSLLPFVNFCHMYKRVWKNY